VGEEVLRMVLSKTNGIHKAKGVMDGGREAVSMVRDGEISLGDIKPGGRKRRTVVANPEETDSEERQNEGGVEEGRQKKGGRGMRRRVGRGRGKIKGLKPSGQDTTYQKTEHLGKVEIVYIWGGEELSSFSGGQEEQIKGALAQVSHWEREEHNRKNYSLKKQGGAGCQGSLETRKGERRG